MFLTCGQKHIQKFSYSIWLVYHGTGTHIPCHSKLRSHILDLLERMRHGVVCDSSSDGSGGVLFGVQLTHRDKACKHLEHEIVIIPDVSPGYNSLGTCVYVLIGTEKAVSRECYWLGVKQGVQSASSQAFWHVLLTIRLKDFFCLSLFAVNIALGKLPDLLKHWPAVLHKYFDKDSWIVLLLLMSSDIIT